MESKICPTCQKGYAASFEVCPEDGAVLQPDGRLTHRFGSAGTDEWPAGKVIADKYAILSKSDSRFPGNDPEGEDEAVSIYRVRSLEWEEPRSLRVLETSLAGDAAAREFRRTARLLLKLDHPNVVAAEAAGDAEDGRPFFATELAEGKTLAELMRAGPLNPLCVCSLSLQIAAALESAHDLGLLHLGLNASNILVLGPAGRERVKVDGFGAAYIRWSRVRRVRNGGRAPALALGDLIPAHPAYAAPEQALGTPPELLDARADEYSLGVLMYQMLCGRLPFWSPAPMSGSPEIAEGEARLALLVSHLEDSLPLASMGSELPQPLTSLVMSLLEKRPELRPATVRSVIEQITVAGNALASRSLPDARPRPGLDPARLAGARQPAEAAGPMLMDAGPASAWVAPPMPSEEASLAALEALTSMASTVPASAPDIVPAAGFEPRALSDRSAPVAPPDSQSKIQNVAVVSAAEPGGQDSASIFKTILPDEPAHRGRAVWAALAILLVAAGVWFFITRGRQQWLGSGPLNPMKQDELRTVEGANSAPAAASPTTQPPAATASPQTTGPAASEPSSASAPAPGSLTPPERAIPSGEPNTAVESPAEASGAMKPASSADQPSATPPNTQPAASPGLASGSATRGHAAGTRRTTKPLSTSEDLAAEVHRAVTAGDVFFALGQYDLAVQTYRRPLKRYPKNKQLLARILRARRAKAAEAQYLAQ